MLRALSPSILPLCAESQRDPMQGHRLVEIVNPLENLEPRIENNREKRTTEKREQLRGESN